MLDGLCYAEFLAYYVLDYSKRTIDENDCQPEVLLEDDEEQTDILLLLPKTAPLMSSKETLRRRNKKRVVRYHTPNPLTKPEEYAHHLLMLFLPFRSETDLLVENSYVIKLNDPVTLEIVNRKKSHFEPWGDLVDQALMNAEFVPRTDNFAQQENDSVTEECEDNFSDNDNQAETEQFSRESSSSG